MAGVAWAGTVALVVVSLLRAPDADPFLAVFALAYVTLTSVAALVAARRPDNPAGWLMLGFALLTTVPVLGGENPDPQWERWLSWAGPVAFALISTFLPLFFPTGRLPSPRWRPVVWVTVGVLAVQVIASVTAMPVDPVVEELTGGVGIACSLLALASLVLRFRRAGAQERQQLKWVTYAAIALIAEEAIGQVVIAIWPGAFVVHDSLNGILIFVVLPLSVGIAILRHGLFDIDLVARRVVVYAVLWLTITAAYAAVAAAFGVAAGATMPLGTAIAVTILATIVFDPARRALERAADRLAYRDRYQRQRRLAVFGERLAGTVPVGELAKRLAEAVRDGLDLAWARVRLAAGTATSGEVSDEIIHSATLTFDDAELGTISCGPTRSGQPLSTVELDLLETLTRQASMAAHNAVLAAELTESRARLVQAQDAERKRLERDIHDGAQQQLVALIAHLRMARNHLERDPARAAQTLADLQDQARRTLAELRELASGIHPSVLSDSGLVVAVEERAARMPIPVTVHATPADLRDRRLPDSVAVTAYFVVAEALANVLKHATATAAGIDLVLADGQLRVEVSDDGVGFAHRPAAGSGLGNLADRVGALGGRLDVVSAPHAGTRLKAALPLGVWNG